MAKVEKPLQEPPSDPSQKEALEIYLEDLRRKVNSQSDLVSDVAAISAIVTTETATGAYTANEQAMLDNLKTDVTNLQASAEDIKTQMNALLDELKGAGFVARS